MKTVAEIFDSAKQAGKTPVSIEIFPPKGKLGVNEARDLAATLVDLNPDFISVTYSAGGSNNKQATSDIACMLQSEFNVPSVAHLTCANATRASITEIIEAMKQKGITNVLALRGDLFDDSTSSDFKYAKDLIPLLVDAGFCVGAAAYPEGHIACVNAEDNIEHLKQKEDAGASFFVTQLFFDNSYFYKFWEDTQAAGIKAPITAGIMPFLSKGQIQRMVFMCGASLPSQIIKLLAKYENDDESLVKAGIEYACNQLVDLKQHGVDGLHVYTMNKPNIAKAAMEALATK